MIKRRKPVRIIPAILAFSMILQPLLSIAAYAEDAYQRASDFSSRRLFVGTSVQDIIRKEDTILSSYEGSYLLQFSSAAEAESAYHYYLQYADFAEPDAAMIQVASEDVEVQTEHNFSDNTTEPPSKSPSDDASDTASNITLYPASESTSDTTPNTTSDNTSNTVSENNSPDPKNGSETEHDFTKTVNAVVQNITNVKDRNAFTEEVNPLSELSDAVSGDFSGDSPAYQSGSGVIALIDTGASPGGNVIEAVSMLGDDVKDDNGHGTKMVACITSENPDARILSIKALDANGSGTPSSVYAAIRYAIEKKVSVINLSLSGMRQNDNSSIADIIQDACRQGITVVGAAGNQGINAKYSLPGSVREAIIAGSTFDKGIKRASSNYGDTVDYYVVSESTSEAAAILSGIFSRDGKIAKDQKKIFDSVTILDVKSDEEILKTLKEIEKNSTDLKASTVEGNWTNIMKYDNRKSTKTLSELYGISRKQWIDSLNKNKAYYNSIPYGPIDWSYRTMQCGGFIGKALIDAGAKKGPLGTGTTDMNMAFVSSYMDYFRTQGIHSEVFATKKELLDAKPEAGDIICMNPRTDVQIPGFDQFGNVGDAHIGLHWGGKPGDDWMWHSTHSIRDYTSRAIYEADASWYKSNNNANAPRHLWTDLINVPAIIGNGGNITSKIAPKSDSAYILYRWSSTSVYARIHKIGTTDAGSVKGAQYAIWYDGKGPENGGKGTGQTFTIGSDGYSNTVTLEAGHTYWYREIKAPDNGNYGMDDTWYQITADQLSSYTSASNPLYIDIGEPTKKAYAYLTKTSSNPSATNNNRCYSLAGAEFKLTSTTPMYHITSKYSGKSLDLHNTNTYNGNNILQWTSYDDDADNGIHKNVDYGINQKFILLSVSTERPISVADAVNTQFYILSAKKPSMAMDASAGGTTNGTNIQLWPLNKTDGQKFRLVSVGGGYYEIVNVKSGLVLDVDNSASSDGTPTALKNDANVQLWQYLGNENQKWKFESTPIHYVLTTDASGNTSKVQVVPDTYIVTETKAPKGYKTATNIKNVTVTFSNTESNPAHIQVQDAPGLDPVPILLQKRDAETGKDVRRV